MAATWEELEQKYSGGATAASSASDPWSELEAKYGAPTAPKVEARVSQKPAAAQPATEDAGFLADVKQGLGNLVAGGVRGAGSIGATILSPLDAAARKLNGGKPVEVRVPGTDISVPVLGNERRNAMDEGLRTMGAEPDSWMFKGGKLGAEIAGTSGVGGAIAKTLMAVPGAAAAAPKLISAIQSGGFVTGGPAATTIGGRVLDMGTRMIGGGINGAAAAGLVNPEDASIGAAAGAALPPAAAATFGAARYVGNAAGSLAKPFTQSGQQEIAGRVIRKFAEGGPTSIDARELVQGSLPTLAEATGNAGIATLQRGARDIRPNAFVERELNNSAARSSLFDEIAGDAGQLAFFKADRRTVAKDLYEKALDPATQNPSTPWIKGQITQLLKTPTITEARKEAQRLAMDRLEKPSPSGSLRAMHDMKTILDDRISEAIRNGRGGDAEALGNLQSKLVNVMDKLSDGYAEARSTYQAMSKPINAMETLQGLRLTDARGNITLAKVQNALTGLEQRMAAAGTDPAKSITTQQIDALKAIRDDLLRQSNTSLGKSIGSNTFQNLATDNILQTVGGNTVSRLADKVGVSGLLGQVGRLAYSGPNEAIRNKMVDMLLQPQLAQPYLIPQLGGAPTIGLLGNPILQQLPYRAAPVLSAGLLSTQ